MIDKSGWPKGSVEMIQAAGLPPAWPALDQAIRNTFSAHTGTSALGLTASNSKDIPASTVSQYIEQGSITTKQLLARIRRSDTVLIQLIYHLIRAEWTDARWISFQGKDGAWQAQQVRGDDLPGYNIVATSNPEPARMDAEEIGGWMQIVQLPAPHREFMARRLGIAMSEVRKLEEAERMEQHTQMKMQASAMLQAQQEQAQAAMQKMNGGNGNGNAVPGAIESRMGSLGG
jgi:hypothetical protein